MKRRLIAAGAAVLVIGLLLGAVLIDADASDKASTVEQDIAGIGQDLRSAERELASSSNPYDYAEASPSFRRLVAKGTPALPSIERAIDASREDGLEEYVLAIAAQRIARVEIGAGVDDPLAWESGKQWPDRWRRHLRRVPGEVERLARADMAADGRNEALIRLGTPALPAILDEVASGNMAVAPAAERLAAGSAEIDGAGDVRVTPEWAKANAARFAALRKLVASAQDR